MCLEAIVSEVGKKSTPIKTEAFSEWVSFETPTCNQIPGSKNFCSYKLFSFPVPAWQ